MPVLFVFFTASEVSGQTVWYVDDSSTSGLNDGTSWENAFVELQSALHVATNGHEIRVAQGIYKPDFDVNSNGHTGNRKMSFELVSGTRLYGGYAGFGAVDPNFRDMGNHTTTLSGDLAGNDRPGFGNNSENSYHVLYVEYVNSNSLLDGFTITGGNANGSNDCSGGGIYSSNSNLMVNNCIIKGNYAEGFRSVFGGPGPGGGGMFNFHSTPTMTNCAFSGNMSGEDGGGMYNYSSSPILTNCTLSRNTGHYGGGIFNHFCGPILTNCILWGNADYLGFGESAQISSDTSLLSLAYCCIQGLDSYAGNGNIGNNPLLTADGLHLQSTSPCINQGDPAGDYMCQVDIDNEARVIDSGIDIGADEFLDTDGDVLPNWWERRYFESSTSALPDDDPEEDGRNNITELEQGTDPIASPIVYYVSVYGDDNWDGLAQEWDGQHGPKATIQAGIDSASSYEFDTVIVSPGVYTGDGNRDLNYGGKSTTIRSTNPENAEIVSETIIDCEGSSENRHRGFWFYCMEQPDSVLSGFTIRNGYAADGGGVRCDFSNPTLTNCTFSNNTASYDGGGMYNKLSNPTMINCAFSNNMANYYGGGMYNESSNPTMTNCTFSGNMSWEDGGGMYNSFGTQTLTNCTFSNNTTNYYGGGMYNRTGGLSMTNCTFSANTASFGGGMYNRTGSLSMTNCTFSTNTARSGGGMCNSSSNLTLINCTLSLNKATNYGGGLYNSSGTQTLNNCILWNNTDQDGFRESSQIKGGTPSLAYCCIRGLDTYSGNGNIGSNPLFVNSNGLDGIPGTEDDDLRLQPGSPCINAGDNSAIPADVLTDLDALPRVHACIVDMGAYEYQENHYFGDADENCVVDLNDYLDFSFCLDRFGYEKNPILEACIQVFDSDSDGDVDLADFAVFQQAVGAAGSTDLN